MTTMTRENRAEPSTTDTMGFLLDRRQRLVHLQRLPDDPPALGTDVVVAQAE